MQSLCGAGFPTTLAFVGDPDKPGVELDQGVQLVRWCQQISDRYRTGVYEGELAKIRDLTATLPDALIDSIIRPAAEAGRTVAVLCEEWHTAWFCRALSDRLHALGLRQHAVLLWNANNLFGFDVIDWPVLDFVSSITTVSKYMKHLMWPYGVNPVVIPNGIPESALAPVDRPRRGRSALPPGARAWRSRSAASARTSAGSKPSRLSLSCASEGMPARMLMRGGLEPYGATVLYFAAECGLAVTDWYEPVGGCGRDRARAHRYGRCADHLPAALSSRPGDHRDQRWRDLGACQLGSRAVRIGGSRGDGGRRRRHGRSDRRGVRAARTATR